LIPTSRQGIDASEMVLDPWTALGLAGNIVQFADFGIRILSRTKKLYDSVDGTLEGYQELDLVIEDLKRGCDLIPRHLSLEDGSRGSDREQMLQKLCGNCHAVADLLVTELEKFRVREGLTGRLKLLKSFSAAAHSVWTKDELDSLERRLSMLREEIQLHITIGTRLGAPSNIGLLIPQTKLIYLLPGNNWTI